MILKTTQPTLINKPSNNIVFVLMEKEFSIGNSGILYARGPINDTPRADDLLWENAHTDYIFTRWDLRKMRVK